MHFRELAIELVRLAGQATPKGHLMRRDETVGLALAGQIDADH